MPDWFTHSLVGWMLGKTTKMDVGIVVAGSLIPDLVKINLLFDWLQVQTYHFFDPLHTPIGAFLTAGIIALFFINSKKVFIFLIVGIVSHFILDFFLIHVNGGMKLFFPFSWEGYQIHIIRSDDYWITFYAIAAAVLFYFFVSIYQKREISKF